MTSTTPLAATALRAEIKEFIVSTLRLKDVTAGDIADDASLVGGSLGLDSIDFLELTVAMEKQYGVKITEADEVKRIFASVNSVAEHVAQHRARLAGA
jgi:acyl carrier protein